MQLALQEMTWTDGALAFRRFTEAPAEPEEQDNLLLGTCLALLQVSAVIINIHQTMIWLGQKILFAFNRKGPVYVN